MFTLQVTETFNDFLSVLCVLSGSVVNLPFVGLYFKELYMKQLVIGCLLAIMLTAVSAAPGLADVVFDFTFGEAASGDYATVSMALVTGGAGLLSLNTPLRYVWNPDRSITGETYSSDALVKTLNVDVYSGGSLVGQYSRGDFYGMILDLSLLTAVDLSFDQGLIGQATPNGPWGVYDPAIPVLTGDFQFYANVGSLAPSGIDYYTIATIGGTGVAMQLTQANVVPEPTTYALLCLSLGVVGLARRKLRITN